MKAHPAADLFPALTGDAFKTLMQSVRDDGLLEPIVTHEGMILDGRNRYRACVTAGVDPRFVEWDGECGTPVRFVAARNVHRRHLTPSQRAMLATRLLKMEREAARARQGTRTDQQPSGNVSGKSAAGGEARDKAGEAVGVSGRLVAEAEKVATKDPARAEKVDRGETTVTQAAREVDTEPLVKAFPADERERAMGFLSQPAIPAQTREEAAEKLAAKPQEERLRIYMLHESGDTKQMRVARAEAVNLPPPTNPDHDKVGGWAISIRTRYAARMASEAARLKLIRAADLIEEALDLENKTHA